MQRKPYRERPLVTRRESLLEEDDWRAALLTCACERCPVAGLSLRERGRMLEDRSWYGVPGRWAAGRMNRRRRVGKCRATLGHLGHSPAGIGIRVRAHAMVTSCSAAACRETGVGAGIEERRAEHPPEDKRERDGGCTAHGP